MYSFKEFSENLFDRLEEKGIIDKQMLVSKITFDKWKENNAIKLAKDGKYYDAFGMEVKLKDESRTKEDK